MDVGCWVRRNIAWEKVVLRVCCWNFVEIIETPNPNPFVT